MTIEFKTIERIERLIHGDLSASERSQALAELGGSDELQTHYEAVKELRTLLQSTFDDAAARSSLEQVAPAVVETLRVSESRDSELEMLAMARFDGERLSDADSAAVDAYLSAHSQLLEGLQEVREFSRMPAEAAADRVNFDVFSDRIMARINEDLATRTASPAASNVIDKPGIWARLGTMFRGPGPALAAVAGAAAAVAVLVPVLNNEAPSTATPDQSQIAASSARTEQPQIVNNYFVTAPAEIETIRAEQGYWGAVTQGDDINSPVVWIQAEEPELLDHDEPGTPNENDRGL